ncbi:MAG TPA: galactose-1-phosphate uridylyltransferase [Chryseosolibacter sp.]|nr:galactose-1-phosphate uridylyltransferase [Chryseosolibacter sp.]
MNDFEGKWEKRWHPLREEWIVYSAHRNSRPWQGAETQHKKSTLEHDPQCYLCPGNTRVGGHKNPSYTGVFIFNNDHPVVGIDAPVVTPLDTGSHLHVKSRAQGIAKVICYDPRHDITLSEMKLNKVFDVFRSFREETKELSKNKVISNVLIFENKGEAVGVSNLHPHCQIYATDFVFKFIQQYIDVSRKYRTEKRRDIFTDIIEDERRAGVRVIAEDSNAIAFIPFFARYAYEVMIFTKRQHSTLVTLTDEELFSLTKVFHEVIRKLDMNFQMSFPYVMTIMQAPFDGSGDNDMRLHLWIQPPYRQPGLIKYLAGPEIGGGNFMADTMPEEKAAELKRIDLTTYSLER